MLAWVLVGMCVVTQMTAHQVVTGNCPGNRGDETPIPISGPEFLGSEP